MSKSIVIELEDREAIADPVPTCYERGRKS